MRLTKLGAGLIQGLCLVMLVAGSFGKLSGFAEDTQQTAKVEDLQNEIEELEKKLKALDSQQQTLEREINTYNSQIKLTELKVQQSKNQISQKEAQISQLGEDIVNLKNRISKLKASIATQENVLAGRLRERYKTRDTTSLTLLLGANTFNELIQKAEYLKVLEKQDQKLINQMTDTKEAYKDQKDIVEDKKQEEEKLKAQLEVEKRNLEQYNQSLVNKKVEKQRLLETTQNDEAKFQKLLAEAQKELNQITNAATALLGTEPKRVKKGEVIGIQGNSGYSFGDHLHFGVYKYKTFSEIVGWNWYYSKYIDPADKLASKSVYWNTGCSGASYRTTGKGKWRWPLDNPTISQGFGYTCWSPVYYGGKDHPAFDMYSAKGAAVYAADEGDAFFCRNCLGDGGNGVFIFHDDGYMTLYWHLR